MLAECLAADLVRKYQQIDINVGIFYDSLSSVLLREQDHSCSILNLGCRSTRRDTEFGKRVIGPAESPNSA